jgi:hypothetical protein
VIGGEYWNATAQALEPFVSMQVRGAWKAPMALPGGQALNQGVEAEVTLLSCSSPGNCAAAGFYTNAPNSTLPFVDSQVAGTWGTAINVPGLAAQNAPNLGSLACGRASDCAGGGSFATASQAAHAFVANVVHGTWRTAQELRGIVNTGRRRADAGVAAIWCGRGRCLAGGFYVDRAGGVQPFIVRQVGGRWGAPVRLPGIVLLSRLNAELGALSCASAGNCAVGGTYNLARPGFSGPPKAFVAAQVSGTWLRPVEVPGIAALHPHGPVVIVAVSCPARGSCVAFGAYRVRTTPSGTVEAGFVVSQR